MGSLRTVFSAAILALAVSPLAFAAGVSVEQPWARATAPGAQTGAVYFSVANAGEAGDTLLSITTDAASMAALHESHAGGDGVMKMGTVKSLPIPAGGSVTLKPGGLHVMLMGLKQPLKQGDSVKLTLNFEKAGAVTAEAKIAGPGALAAPKD